MPAEEAVDYIVRTYKEHIREIKVGGSFVFLYKIKNLFRKIIFYIFLIILLPFLLPMILIIRIIRPYKIIRFGVLLGNRIGNLAGNTEIYLCNRDAGNIEEKTYDVFYISTPICNNQLKKMWQRTLSISKFVKYLNSANVLLPGYKKHQVPRSSDRDIHNLLVNSPLHLSFTEAEERFGKNRLEEMMIPNNAPFFCFIGRDPAYLKTVYPNRNMDYHNYRDMDIKDFIPSVNELTERGYFAFRMGKKVQEKLKIDNVKFFDYSNKFRTDFLDIFLCAKCKFFISGNAGFDAVPMTVFRRPTVIVNMVPVSLIRGWSESALYIFKKHWLIQEQRFLSISEIVQSEIGTFYTSDQYIKAGIELINNSPEEIKTTSIEMDERLKGTWVTNGEDEEMQLRFKSLFKSTNTNSIIACRIGSDFLRENF